MIQVLKIKEFIKLFFLFSGIAIGLSCSPVSSAKKFTSNKIWSSNKNISKQKKAQIDSLFGKWNHTNSPGTSISVIKDGKMLLSKNYGSSNLEYNIPISEHTIFHVASVSKQFTAFTIALLEDQGKLSIDDDIRKYLPEMPDLGNKITIRNLLYHTSGLRDQFELLQLAGWRLDDVITDEHILKLIYHQKALNFKPGDEFQYSNSNYTLLAKIAETVTGEKFSKWTEEHIFIPLGMKHTFFYDNYGTIVKNRAYSYSTENEGYKNKALNFSTVGATGLFTTTKDLALWADNFQTKKVGNQKIMERMDRTGLLNNGREIHYAYGQGISTYQGLPLIYHPGSDAGYRAYLGRFPSQGLAIIVLSNLDSFKPEEAAMKIANIYLPEHFTPQLTDQDHLQKDSELVVIPTAVYNEYQGSYAIKKPLLLNITYRDNILRGKITGKNDSHILIPKTQSEFEVPSLNAKIVFEKDINGTIKQLSFNKEGETMIAPKIYTPETLDNADLKEFVGKYYSEELSTTYTFVLEKGRLIAKHQRNSDIPLKLLAPDFMTGNEIFKDIGIIRDSKQNVSGIKVTSRLIRDLWFEKVE